MSIVTVHPPTEKQNGSDLAETLDGLFVRLNTPEDKHLKIEDRFTHFPYINGDLFETRLPNAAFDKKMRDILLSSCNFDWGHITPSIFGSMFQAAMSPEERRTMGAHYTEEANILEERVLHSFQQTQSPKASRLQSFGKHSCKIMA